MAAKIVDIFTGKPKRKKPTSKPRRNTRARGVYWSLLNECQLTGKPDYDLIDRIVDDIRNNSLSDMDFFAVYLYRKKCE